MPIQVQCQCGTSLKVPDTMAGKSGKCPKCQQLIKIPSALGKPATASAPAAKTTAPAGASGAAKQQAPSAGKKTPVAPAFNHAKAVDDFFDSAGLVKKTGTFCPDCNTAVAPGAAICVKCGLNFETGEKIKGFETEEALAGFGNKHLNEAARMMAREKEVEKVQDAAGTPWWVMLCVLLGILMLVGTGLILVDAKTMGAKPADYIFAGLPVGKIQRMPIGIVLAGTAAIIFGMVTTFAHLAITAYAFSQKIIHGIGSLIVPMYAPIYGITKFKRLKGTVISYWVGGILAAITAFLALR